MASKVVGVDKPYDFHSLELSLSAEVLGQQVPILSVIKGFEELEYTWTVNSEYLRGANRNPQDHTDGEAEYSASATLFRSTWEQAIAKCAALGVGIALIRFDWTVKYTDPRTKLIVPDTLHRVKIIEGGHSHSRSPDPLMTSVGLKPLNIFFDGVDIFGAKLGVA